MKPRVLIVGGGLAGMAAAVALAGKELEVTLLEAKRWLGGRAGSFEDPTTGETVDHCQHVAMGCCTNFLDFCRRTAVEPFLRRDRTLHFLSPEGKRFDFAATPWLPAPLHLLPALWRLKFLSRSARWSILRAMRGLARTKRNTPDTTVAAWLEEQHQGPEAIDRFWSVVLVSALGETLDRASLAAARQVFVEGFLAHREAYHLLVPTLPLVELYEQYVLPCLQQQGVAVRKSTSVVRLADDGARVSEVQLASGESISADHVILAIPWRPAVRMLQGSLAESLAEPWRKIEPSPITGVHLWFDRPITDLPHAVLVGRLSQWLFARPASSGRFAYQVVISASRMLSGRTAEDIAVEVLDDLRAAFPIAREAHLLQSRVITQPESVFSVTPEFSALRPNQETNIPGLSLAGDWTSTQWPATMESAVRSGYLAAQAVLKALSMPASLIAADLPRSWALRLIS